MDFMNLNQSAHGDREFGFIETRMRLGRKTVVGHWRDPAVVDADRHLGARRVRLARGADAAGRALRRQHAPGRRHRRRQGRGADPARLLGERLRRRRPGRRGRAPSPDADGRRAASTSTRTRTSSCRRCARGGDAARVAARRGADRAGSARRFSRRAASRRSPTRSRILHGLKQLPGIAVQRLMADGYGFGGEGDWKTAALVRITKVMGAGLAGGTSFMEDYTYHLAPDGPKVLGAHMLEVCPSIAGATAVVRDPSALDRRQATDPVRLVFTAAPGPAVVVGPARPRRPLPPRRERGRRRAAGRGAAAAAGRPGGVASRSRTSRPRPRPG